MVVPISKASANQRAGRAGRTAPGKYVFIFIQEKGFRHYKISSILQMLPIVHSMGIQTRA